MMAAWNAHKKTGARMRHERCCFVHLYHANRYEVNFMTESNEPVPHEEKDKDANKGAKAPDPSSQDNDDVSEVPADPNNDPGR